MLLTSLKEVRHVLRTDMPLVLFNFSTVNGMLLAGAGARKAHAQLL